MRLALIALVCFVLGAGIALIARTALHDPYADGSPSPAPAQPSAAPPAEHHHAGTPTPTPAVAVNKICAVCGMEVDPTVTTADWHGKAIGFGCTKCPPKFAADPERYGPSALQDRKAP